MRIYRPPQFNDLCRIWLRAFPRSLADWNGFPPDRPADILCECQVYRPREGYSRLLHAMSDDAVDTFGHAGDSELRLPKGIPVATVWGISRSQDWSGGALVEVPVGSGRLYVLTLVETKHRGFPNEYVVGILAQLSSPGLARPMACGAAASCVLGVGAGVAPLGLGMGGGARIKAPGGITIDTNKDTIPTWWFPMSWVTPIQLGTAVAGQVVVVLSRRDLGLGGAMTGKLAGAGDEALLGIGTAAEASLSPTRLVPSLGLGTGATVVQSSGQGTGPVGGPTCETAAAVELGSTVLVSVPQFGERWLKTTIAVMGNYKVTVKRLTGQDLTVRLKYGACPSPGQYGTVGSSPTGGSTTSALNPGTQFTQFLSPASVSTYEVKIEQV